jgi:hypothetical protein
MQKYNLRTSYSVYKESIEEPVPIKVYIEIVNNYMKFLMQKLFNKGSVMFPERMGTLNIIGHRSTITVEDGVIKGAAPDWKGTKDLWAIDEEAKANKQLVYHFNESTNGVRYRFQYSKNRVMVPNKTLYTLRMSRENKRRLSSSIKQGVEYLIK